MNVTKQLTLKYVCMEACYACFIIGFMRVGGKLNIFRNAQGNTPLWLRRGSGERENIVVF
jgi:hypothetical protein